MKIDITTPYVQSYSKLFLVCLTPEHHERTCNYWYTVLLSGASSHTAFTTKEGLMNWLDERGLRLTDTLPDERGTHKTMHIEGRYNSASYLDVNAFKAIQPLFKVVEMSNADYTLGKVTQDEQGIRTIHSLNPNVHERVVFPYFEVQDGIFDRRIVNASPDIMTEHTDTREPLRPLKERLEEARQEKNGNYIDWAIQQMDRGWSAEVLDNTLEGEMSQPHPPEIMECLQELTDIVLGFIADELHVQEQKMREA